MKRPAAGEAAQLVADLLGGDATRAEAAAARLLVLGLRAVPHLTSALAAADEATAVRLLGVVEALPATRRSVPALDAATTLGPDAAARVAAVWARWLGDEDRALSTLAFDRLAAVVLEAASAPAARRVALDAIRALGDDASEQLLARLPPEPPPPAPEAAATPPAAPASSPRAGGPHATPDTAEALRQHVAAHGAAMPLSDLHHLLERARERQQAAREPGEAADWLAARGAVHQALAGRGSTVALYDLRELLERLATPPPLGALAALRAIGDGSCLEPLAAAWSRLDDPWTRDQLRAAAAEICARHRITARHATMKRVVAKAPALADAVARRPKPGG